MLKRKSFGGSQTSDYSSELNTEGNTGRCLHVWGSRGCLHTCTSVQQWKKITLGCILERLTPWWWKESIRSGLKLYCWISVCAGIMCTWEFHTCTMLHIEVNACNLSQRLGVWLMEREHKQGERRQRVQPRLRKGMRRRSRHGEWINSRNDWKGPRSESSVMNIYYWVEAVRSTRENVTEKRSSEVGQGGKIQAEKVKCVVRVGEGVGGV